MSEFTADNWRMYSYDGKAISKFESLCGRTIKCIERYRGDLETLIFHVKDKNSLDDIFIMRGKECDSSLESCTVEVFIEDIVGDLNDLIGEPLLKATVEQNILDVSKSNLKEQEYLWTF